ncbi:MAG: hypothetical protein ACLUDQ_09845 [Bilophila wadsworthia]
MTTISGRIHAAVMSRPPSARPRIRPPMLALSARNGVEFPQADERKQEQQAEKVRPGKVEGGSEDAHKHGAGDDPRKMF